MSIEHTPPTHDGETGQNHAERPSADFDRVHSLCEILEPAFEQIENGTPLEDAPLRDKLTELTVLLAELHPADVADVLSPCRRANAISFGFWSNPKTTAKYCWKYPTRCEKR